MWILVFLSPARFEIRVRHLKGWYWILSNLQKTFLWFAWNSLSSATELKEIEMYEDVNDYLEIINRFCYIYWGTWIRNTSFDFADNQTNFSNGIFDVFSCVIATQNKSYRIWRESERLYYNRIFFFFFVNLKIKISWSEVFWKFRIWWSKKRERGEILVQIVTH